MDKPFQSNTNKYNQLVNSILSEPNTKYYNFLDSSFNIKLINLQRLENNF